MGFHGIRREPLQMTKVFHGIPWNFCAAKWHITKFHGIPWKIPWNSMELWCRQMTYHLVPWNSMELWHCHFMPFYPGWTSKWYSMEFQGTLESSNKKSTSSMGFHGIKRALLQMTQIFHGIPWNIPWNSMELWCRQMTYHLVPWNSMEHSMEFNGTLVPPNDISLCSMEFHGTLTLPLYGILPWLDFQVIFNGIPGNIPWNSMELCCRQMKYHLVPWNSMEYSMEFHGTLAPPHDISLSSMEFHGTFHGIPWNFGAAKWSIT